MKKYLLVCVQLFTPIILLLSCNGSSSTTPTSTSGKTHTTFNSGGTLPGTVTTSFLSTDIDGYYGKCPSHSR